jgi:hypothetical protein
VALQERRAPGSLPPSQKGVAGPAGPVSQQVGPKGTLVIDSEKLLGSAALTAGVEAGGTGPVRMGQAAGNAVPAQAASGGAGRAASGGAWSAPAGPMPAAGLEERDEIPVIVEKPASSRTWIWAVAGLGFVAVAGMVAVLVSQGAPGGGTATPEATGPGVAPPAGSAAAPGPSAEAGVAATTGSPATTARPEATAKPQAGQEQPQQGEPQPKTQPSGRTRNTKVGGAAPGRLDAKPRGGKVPPSRTAEPPLPEGKPDF